MEQYFHFVRRGIVRHIRYVTYEEGRILRAGKSWQKALEGEEDCNWPVHEAERNALKVMEEA